MLENVTELDIINAFLADLSGKKEEYTVRSNGGDDCVLSKKDSRARLRFCHEYFPFLGYIIRGVYLNIGNSDIPIPRALTKSVKKIILEIIRAQSFSALGVFTEDEILDIFSSQATLDGNGLRYRDAYYHENGNNIFVNRIYLDLSRTTQKKLAQIFKIRKNMELLSVVKNS